MIGLKDTAKRELARRWRRGRRRSPSQMGDPVLRSRIDALGSWFQNIDINGTPTKLRSYVGEPLDAPRNDWELWVPHLPDLDGKTVLDIGCNAGYYSIECKRRGARHVVGIDVNQGRPEDFIEQARFAASELGLAIEFRHQDLFDVIDAPYDVVLFLGVLYHLDDPIAGLEKAASLTRETLLLGTQASTRRGAVLEHHRNGLNGDATSPWTATPRLVDELIEKCGLDCVARPRTNSRRVYFVMARR